MDDVADEIEEDDGMPSGSVLDPFVAGIQKLEVYKSNESTGWRNEGGGDQG